MRRMAMMMLHQRQLQSVLRMMFLRLAIHAAMLTRVILTLATLLLQTQLILISVLRLVLWHLRVTRLRQSMARQLRLSLMVTRLQLHKVRMVISVQ